MSSIYFYLLHTFSGGMCTSHPYVFWGLIKCARTLNQHNRPLAEERTLYMLISHEYIYITQYIHTKLTRFQDEPHKHICLGFFLFHFFKTNYSAFTYEWNSRGSPLEQIIDYQHIGSSVARANCSSLHYINLVRLAMRALHTHTSAITKTLFKTRRLSTEEINGARLQLWSDKELCEPIVCCPPDRYAIIIIIMINQPSENCIRKTITIVNIE